MNVKNQSTKRKAKEPGRFYKNKMEAIQIQRIVEETERLKLIDNTICARLGIKRGDNDPINYQQELKKEVIAGSVPPVYFHTLESENYSSLTGALETINAFTEEPASAENEFEEYLGERQKRTWAQMIEEDLGIKPPTKTSLIQKLNSFFTRQ